MSLINYIIDNNAGSLTGQNINGSLSATTFYGDGSNLTGLPSGGGSFTGNTSGDCIQDIWVQNINSCNGTLQNSGNVNVNGWLSATTFYGDGSFLTGISGTTGAAGSSGTSGTSGTSGGPFTGNTSGDCIQDIWVQNINSCNGNLNIVGKMNTTDFVGIRVSSPTSTLDVSGNTGYNQLRMRLSYTPTGSTDSNGNTGDIAWDNTFFYWKTSTQWLRISGQTW